MLAFLMPLKVVMLLGSEGIPSYIPETFRGIGKNSLIISLVMLSLASYVLSAIFKQFSEKTTERGVKKLLEKTQKIIIFENQDKFASRAYTRYVDALAGLVFSLVTLGLFTIFYRDMALFITITLSLSYFIAYSLYSSVSKFKKIIIDKPQPTAVAISNIVFLLIFLYIVVDYLYLAPPVFIIGLVSLILSRLMLARLSFTASYLFTLKQDEGKINALFFHNHAFIPAIKSQQGVWDLLTNNSPDDWLVPVLKEATNSQNIGNIVTEWQQTRLNNILVLRAEAEAHERTFLIKVFEQRVSSQALHEATLMTDALSKELPCPPFLLATMVGNNHCHVFDITNHELVSSKQALNYKNTINEQILALTPPKMLVGRYKRSKAFLWERIDKDMLKRLQVVANEKSKDIIQEVEASLSSIKAVIQKLPLSLVAPKLNNTALLKNSENQVVTFHWPDWAIEPLGAGIKLNEKNNIIGVIQSASIQRPEIKDFPSEAYELVSLLAAFEQEFHQQQYEDAIELLHQVLDRLTELTSDTIEHKTPPSAQL